MAPSVTIKAIRELNMRIEPARKTLARERATLNAMIEQRRKLRETLTARRPRAD